MSEPKLRYVAVLNPQGKPGIEDWNRGEALEVKGTMTLVRFFNPKDSEPVWIETKRLIEY